MPRRFWPGGPGSGSGPTNWRQPATLASRTAKPGVSWRGSAPPPLLSPTDGATRFAGWPRPRQDLIAGAWPAWPSAAASCSRSRSPIPGWRRESPPGRRTCCARPALAPGPAWWRPHHRPQPAALSGRFLPRPLRSRGWHLRVVPDVRAGVRPACWPGRPGPGKATPMLEATKLIVAVKNIEMPDERHACEHASLDVVNLPGVTIARTVYLPGWKWSTDVKPVVGTEACQAAHTGYIISGWR